MDVPPPAPADDDEPLLLGPIHGLRTWTVVVGPDGEERLAGPHAGTSWPLRGGWLRARCSRDEAHDAPAAGCDCGVHAWHPRPRAARRVLAGRGDVVGVVEVRGPVELHEDGLRAAQGRPAVLVVTPRAHRERLERLAVAHDVELVAVDGPAALLEMCRERGLGLDPGTVASLVGPARAAAWRRTRRRRRRVELLRLTAAVAIAVALAVAGVGLITDPSGPRTLHGRTGEIHVR